MTRASMRGVVVCAGLLAVTQGIGRAGDLNPPAGPVSSNIKPLSEIEPRTAITQENTPGNAESAFRITAPGSYYLTGNVLLAPGKAKGIEILASDVTIDLNGFTIDGSGSTAIFPAGCIWAAQGVARVAVSNGWIVGSRASGVNLGFVTNARLHQVSARSIESTGFVLGDGAIVTECSASGCGSSGFVLGADSVVQRCSAIDNSNGFHFSGANNRITDSIAVGNNDETVGSGIVMQSNGGLIADNYVAMNGQGIWVQGAGCTVVRNVVKANGQQFAVVAGNHVGAIVSNPALAGPFDNLSN